MYSFLIKLKNLIIISSFVFISFMNFFQSEFSIFYNLPIYFIPTLNFIFGLLIIILYITSNKEKDKTENEFTTVVNHTFRTPLTSILWMTKELEEDSSKEEKLLLLQKINNMAKKVLDIVDLFVGIKDVNNRASYNFEATSIRDIIEKTIAKYREDINKKNINFNISSFRDVPLITLDLNKITFVIDSIIENSLFYTKPNGKITIDSNFDGNIIKIFIQDTGIGFDNINKMKVFTKFWRSKEALLMNPNGMGLKLYLSKQIIERHKGKINLKSEGENKGSVFTIELPLIHKK